MMKPIYIYKTRGAHKVTLHKEDDYRTLLVCVIPSQHGSVYMMMEKCGGGMNNAHVNWRQVFAIQTLLHARSSTFVPAAEQSVL